MGSQIKFNRKIRIHLIITVTFLIFYHSYAQTPRFDQLKVLKNINNYQVNCIYQDSSGFIWFGTTEGLVRHDGIESYKIELPDTFKTKNITAIYESPKGQLWIGFDNGLITFLIQNKLNVFSPEEGLSISPVSNIFVDSENILWFSTLGEGVYYYSGKVKKRLYNLNTDDGLADNFAYCFVEDNDKNIYIGTDNGISVYSIERDTFTNRISMKDGLPDNIVKHLVLPSKNTLWIGMEEGICKYNMKENRFYTFNTLENMTFNNFICPEENEIWISTARHGVLRLMSDGDGNSALERFTAKYGLISNNTTTIFADSEKNIWVGSKTGVSKRRSNYFEFIDEKDNIPVSNIYSLIKDNRNNTWVASQDGLFCISHAKDGTLTVQKIFHDKIFAGCSFISLYEDTEGFIWAGTYGNGVYKINPLTNDFRQYSVNNGLSNNNIIHINGDTLAIWFSTVGGGISRLDKRSNKFLYINTDNGLSSNYIYSTMTGSDGKIWIASDGGEIHYYGEKGLHKINVPDSLYSHVIYMIQEDSHGNIWFISADKGLYKYDGKSIVNFNEMNGLRTNDLKSFTIADNGDMVLVHNLGIDVYNPNKQSFSYFGENYNIADLQPGLNALHKDKEGNIWIGHQTGIFLFKPNKYNEVHNNPNIIITNIQLELDNIEAGKHHFRHNQNHFKFNYIAFWYKDPESLVYRHKLDNYDMDWIETGPNLSVTYSSLPPGKYSFIVQVSNSPGNWYGSEDAMFKFAIGKPFWKKLWFIVFVILLLVVIIYSYIQLRLQRLRNDKIKLEAEVRKRTQEILMQKEEIEAQRDEIEAQRDEVMQQRDRIAQQNENITASIHYASRIQNAMLPDLGFFEKKFNSFFVLNKPRDIVSGDFYFTYELPDGSTVILVADCTGHGVPGAFMSILGMSQLKEILNSITNSGVTPAQILKELRERIKVSLKQTGAERESKDGMDISFCLINPEKRKLQYAGAYNPLVLIRKGELIEIKGDRMPIGIQVNERPEFTNHEIELQNGDLLYLFSDGYADQMGGEKLMKYKSGRFKEFLTQISVYPLQEQLQLLSKEHENWVGTYFQVDDILVVGVKI